MFKGQWEASLKMIRRGKRLIFESSDRQT
jgi:hypothetical protein